MKILQEKVDNGQPSSGPSAGKERPPVNGPRAGDEREKNKDSVRSDVDIAQADEKMAAPSENGVDAPWGGETYDYMWWSRNK